MSASVKPPVYTSVVHRKLQHHNWRDTEIDFQADDLGLDLTDISGISGFLMNEPPDSSGHFYPPWVSELDPVVKPEPMIFEESNHPRQQSAQSAPPTVTLDTKVDMSLVNTTNTNTRETPSSQRGPKAQTYGVGSTVRKTASGGVTRRRSSSKEEQAKKRRERNRVLARRTRLRKKFFFQSLQQQVADLQHENERLKGIITTRCPESSDEILRSCSPRVSSVVADCASQATAFLAQSDFLLVKALQSSQPSFCVTDPQLPDNPIVYASDNFIQLTGYERSQVLGRNCRFLQGPDTDPDAVAKIRKGIEQGTDTSVLLRQYKADGTVFWNHVFVAALRNNDHKIINYVGIQHPLEKEPTPQVLACINDIEVKERTKGEQIQAGFACWTDSPELLGTDSGAAEWVLES
uniref:Putative LOV domain-containing protein n=1 Tax=Sargassum hemiphyllum TaxID=127544 RepID=A0A126X321_SARHM|nr:putative LOV domain-containing protein [Sargassum hemiphyllum]